EHLFFVMDYDIPHIKEYILQNYENAIIKSTPNREKTFEAITNGTADAMVIESYVKDSLDYSFEFPYLKYYNKTNIDIPVSIAVSKEENPLVFSIINKSIKILDKNSVDDTIYSFIAEEKQGVDLITLVRYYFPDFIPVIFSLTLVILSIIIGYIYSVNTKLKSVAFIDSLTGYKNYYKFMEELRQHLKDKSACDYYIVYFDIQNFKYINTSFGYETGDKVLKVISSELERTLGSDECFARVYADNFVVLLRKTEDSIEKELKDFALNTQKTILDGLSYVNISARCGVYEIQPEDEAVSDIIDNANIARRLIGDNKNKFISYYDDEVRNSIFKEKEIEDNMYSSLKNGEFKVFIQPKNNMKTGEICGGEALIRWIRPKRGLIFPNEFIPIFEKNGFIVNIDMFV
ncbi:MAG: diguanylate cyclase, partial [Oscillospiraceae bacterium]